MQLRPLLLLGLTLCGSGMFTSLAIQSASANTPCTPHVQDTPIRSTLGSAGFFSNLRNAEHSINFQMDLLLDEAMERATQVSRNHPPCVKDCHVPRVAVVFKSSPNILLHDYEEASSCEKLLHKTTIEPIVYANRSFSSKDDAKKWYRDLTRGRGADGKDLYTRCPGLCSPSYSSMAFQKAGKFIVTTTIICGHARDKDDDQYLLSASLRWLCL